MVNGGIVTLALMADLQTLMGVAALDLAAAVSPGPAFLLITQTAASSRRETAWATAAATVLGSLTWAAAALLGWQVVLAKAAGLYRLVQAAGGLYLCVIGWSTWRNASQPLAVTARAATTPAAGFRKGLMLGLSNPKVIVFFGTIFTTLFTPQTPSRVRWLSLAVILVIESLWYGSLATLFATGAVQRRYRVCKAGVERLFGGLLAFFGVRLVWNSART